MIIQYLATQWKETPDTQMRNTGLYTSMYNNQLIILTYIFFRN